MIDTALIILEQALLHVPLILGAYISLSLLKVPDLSLESAFVFGALCGAFAVSLTVGMPWILLLKVVLIASMLGVRLWD